MQNMPPPMVKTALAVTKDVPLNIRAVGSVEAIASVEVKSRVAGQVLRVAFQEGQNVSKGQLLFEIDPQPLQEQISQIRAELVKDRALEQQARANVAKDEATLKQYRSAADRGLALSKEGIFSREQTEQVVASADAGQASLEADRAAVASATAAIQADEARLSQTQLQLGYTKIMAPISGRAGAVAIKAGNLVKDNDVALVTLLQMSPIYVGFGIPEQILPEVRKYQRQRPLVVYASPEAEQDVSGTLKFIDNTVDTATGTIRLKAEFSNKEQTLWPGQFVNVRAQLNVEKGRVVVPTRAVQTGPDGKYVWVVAAQQNTVAMRPVQVLRSYDDEAMGEATVIGSGLSAGETVVAEGQMRVAPGMKVQPQPLAASKPGNSSAAS
jgi:membrane fusion protein, multidrug efflux system